MFELFASSRIVILVHTCVCECFYFWIGLFWYYFRVALDQCETHSLNVFTYARIWVRVCFCRLLEWKIRNLFFFLCVRCKHLPFTFLLALNLNAINKQMSGGRGSERKSRKKRAHSKLLIWICAHKATTDLWICLNHTFICNKYMQKFAWLNLQRKRMKWNEKTKKETILMVLQ